MALTYEQIIESIVAESGMTKVAFLKLTIEQRVYLVNKYLGSETSKLYETLNEEQVVEIASDKTQGKFTYKFQYITEATDVFTDISALLNTSLYGIYNTNTRYFVLTETFSSLMKHLDKHHLVTGILSSVAATSTSTSVSVPSIGNSSVSISALEIKELLDKFTKSIYTKHSPTMDILVESLLLSLLDVNFEDESIVILNNYIELSETPTELGNNIVNTKLIRASDNVVIGGNGLSFNIEDGESSEIRIHQPQTATVNTVYTTEKYFVEVTISKYEAGSLQIFFGGIVLYNDTPTKGTLTFEEKSPGTAKQAALAIQSDDFKGTISNISIRKITKS
jgi:hypothetical protein